jgi:hypothetical protein
MKISKRGREAFEYYVSYTQSPTCLLATVVTEGIVFDDKGVSACEAFYMYETHGKLLPTWQSVLLAQALLGKKAHGITVANLAEDYVGRLVFASELQALPKWVSNEVYELAQKVALAQLAWIPTFVRDKQDVTTMTVPLPLSPIGTLPA